MRVCGKNVFNELDYKKIRKILLSDTFRDKDIINRIKEYKIKYIITDQKIMDKMLSHNQGIIIEIDDYEYGILSDNLEDSIVLMLDHLEDPHNFGAIIRTCEAAGIKSIIIPKDRGVTVNETVMKTSSGALNHVNIIQVTNLVNTINKLKDQGYFVYAADMGGKNYKEVNFSSKVVIVIGNEGSGISKIVKNNSDEIISIPMKGVVNSLNASVAAAILIYGIGE